ncbi:hypothetical protein FNH08_43290, partial [Streptomyces spongiae]|nr:hypothetical protein [Streptomyces spongiae]
PSPSPSSTAARRRSGSGVEPYDFLPLDPTGTPWHDDASRETRWAALRRATAALTDPVDPTDPPDRTHP